MMPGKSHGFTLLEMLIVVAIITVLVAAAIPIFANQLEKSREAADLANVRSAYAVVLSNAMLGYEDPDDIEVVQSCSRSRTAFRAFVISPSVMFRTRTRRAGLAILKETEPAPCDTSRRRTRSYWTGRASIHTCGMRIFFSYTKDAVDEYEQKGSITTGLIPDTKNRTPMCRRSTICSPRTVCCSREPGLSCGSNPVKDKDYFVWTSRARMHFKMARIALIILDKYRKVLL